MLSKDVVFMDLSSLLGKSLCFFIMQRRLKDDSFHRID